MIKTKIAILSSVSLFTVASASVGIFYALNSKKSSDDDGIVKYVDTEYASMDFDANDLFSSEGSGIKITDPKQKTETGEVITDLIQKMSGDQSEESADSFAITAVKSKLVYSNNEDSEVIPESTLTFEDSNLDKSSQDKFNNYIETYSKDPNNLNKDYKQLKITNNVVSSSEVKNGFETNYVIHNTYSFENSDEVYNMCGIKKTSANTIPDSVAKAKKGKVKLRLMTKFTLKCLVIVHFDHTDTTDKHFLHFQDDGHYLSQTNILDWVRRKDIWLIISDYIKNPNGADINFNISNYVKDPFDNKNNHGLNLKLAEVSGEDGSYSVGKSITDDKQILGNDKLYLQLTFANSNYVRGTCSILIDGFDNEKNVVSSDNIDSVLAPINTKETTIDTTFNYDSDFKFMSQIVLKDNMKNFNSNWFALKDKESATPTFMESFKNKLVDDGIDVDSITNVDVVKIESSYIDSKGTILPNYKDTKIATDKDDQVENFNNMGRFITENIADIKDIDVKSETTTYKDLNGPTPEKDINRKTSYVYSTVSAISKGETIDFNPTAFGVNESLDTLKNTAFSQDEFTNNADKYQLHNSYSFKITIGPLFTKWKTRSLSFGSLDYGFVTNKESIYQYIASYAYYYGDSEDIYGAYKNGGDPAKSFIGERYYIAKELLDGSQSKFFTDMLPDILKLEPKDLDSPDKLVKYIQIVGAFSSPTGAVEEKNVIYDKVNNENKDVLTNIDNKYDKIYIGIQIKGISGVIYYQTN